MIVDRYYYHQLNKQEQAIYKAFYNGAMAHQDIIPIPVRGEFSQESFERIFMAMTRDNPLIYFLNQSATDDQELAKMLVPRRKYVVGGIVYSDEKGTKVDRTFTA